jgi:mannitol/fructose-specific phosphotransferase system IIA component (Ntr-type)
MTFWKQFKTKACSIDLASATKEEALREVVGHLVAGGVLAPTLEAAAVRALTEREQLASTGVGQGVAIPHVKLDGLDSVAASLCVHREGIEWAALDGEPVYLVFTVLRPSHAGDRHDPDRHLEMMRWISRLARSTDFRRFAAQAKNRTELVGLLREMQQV